MTKVRDMLQRWESINAVQITADCMEQEKEAIVSLNTDQLYEQGEDSKGNKLPSYRNRYYAQKKLKMRGKPITDAYLTGKFQSLFNLSVQGNKFSITSTDPKTKYLVEKNGWDKIFGLTKENTTLAWRYFIRAPFVQKVAKITGCKISN